MCVQQKLQSDADNEDSNKTGRVPRLILISAERICHVVGFVMRRFISYHLYEKTLVADFLYEFEIKRQLTLAMQPWVCIFRLTGDHKKNHVRFYTSCVKLALRSLIYIQVYIRLNRVTAMSYIELYIPHSRSIFSTIFNSECRVLDSILQVYIQHCIQNPNAELYIRLSRSIFSTIFNIRM